MLKAWKLNSKDLFHVVEAIWECNLHCIGKREEDGVSFTISCISQLWEKDIKVYGTQKERNDSENGDEIILTMRVGKAADGKMLLAIRELESSFDSHFEAY